MSSPHDTELYEKKMKAKDFHNQKSAFVLHDANPSNNPPQKSGFLMPIKECDLGNTPEMVSKKPAFSDYKNE